MNFKNDIFIISLILIILLSISCVSAAQDDLTLNDDDLSLNENIAQVDSSTDDLSQLATDNDNDNINQIGQSNEDVQSDNGGRDIQSQVNDGENNLSSEIGTFTELENAFLGNDTFTFEKDYEASSGDSRINIKNSIVIDGNGHYIDAKGFTGIFQTENSDSKNINVTIKNLIFKNGRADYGGAIYVKGVDGVHYELIDCRFNQNFAVTDGGAIYFKSDEGSLKIVNTQFNGNKALPSSSGKKNGGAIAIFDAHSLTLENSIFNDNYAEGYGGAIYTEVPISVNKTEFNNNRAYNSGGGIYLDVEVDEMNVEDSLFYNNYADDGAAFYINDDIEKVNVKNTKFSGNIAGGVSTVPNGGAICNFGDGTIYLYNSVFISNGALTEAEFSILFNDAKGGAIFTKGNLYIDGCNFTGNTANDHGGAVYTSGKLTWGDNPSIFMSNDVRTGHVATANKGGAIYANSFENGPKGSIFINNSAWYGGAIYINSKSDVTFELCIFENNTAKQYDSGHGCGAAIYIDSASSKLSLKNNFFINNYAPEDKGVYNCGIYGTISNNWWGTNNPDFNENYLVEWRRVGSNYKRSDSNPLNVVFIGDKNSSLLGDSINLVFKFVDSYGNDFTGKLPNWDVNFTSSKNGEFSNKTISGNVVNVVFTPTETGNISIFAQVPNELLSWQLTLPGDFDYLQKLINEAEGALVLERDFTYSVGVDTIYEGIVIDKPLVIDGNGHTIDARSLSRIFYVHSDNVTIKDLNLINGMSDKGSAIFLMESSNAIITNCSFSNNDVKNFGIENRGGAIYSYYGTDNTINNCTFTNNHAYNGGAIRLETSNSTPNLIISNSIFKNNSAKYGGAVYIIASGVKVSDSVFSYNVAESSGGAIYWDGRDGTLMNSIFLDNKATAYNITVVDDGALNITFNGEPFFNAISSYNISFSNITYWNGEIVSADDYKYPFAAAGQNLTLEIYSNGALVKNVTLKTDEAGQAVYDYFEMENGNYTYRIYNEENSYYYSTEVSGNFTISRNESTGDVTINIDENTEFDYGNCSISFTVEDKQSVRVLISDVNGTKIFLDEIVDADFVAPQLNASDDLYRITVYNIGDKTQNPAKDSKTFKVNRISIPDAVDDVTDTVYGNDVVIKLNGNADSYLITITNENNVTVFSTHTSESSVSVPNLDAGEYNLTVFAYGENIYQKQSSRIFKVEVQGTDNYFNVSVDDVTYGENATVTVNADIDGEYLVDINSTIVKVNVRGGTGNATVFLAAGEYYANVSAANDNYINHATNATFTVEKAESNVVVYGYENITLGELAYIYIDSDYPGEYEVTISQGTDIISNETITGDSYELPELDIGTYNVTVTQLGNENITGSCDLLEFNVTGVNYVEVIAFDTDYGREITIYILADVDGNYTLEINETNFTVEVIDGFGFLDYELVWPAGEYYANASFDNPNYDNVIENATFKINMAESNIHIESMGNVSYGEDIILEFYDDYGDKFKIIITDQDGNVELDINTTDVYTLNLSGFDAGNYTALVINPGDESIIGSNDTINFTISKAKDYPIDVDVLGSIMTITLPETATGNVSLSIGNKTFTQEIKDGKVVFDLGELALDDYVAEITYPGDKNYEASSLNKTVTVEKLTIIASNAKYGWAKTVTYQVKVQDNNGNLESNVPITFKINGKTYTANTNAKGIATVALNLNVGSYDINISSSHANNVSKKITVVKRLLLNKNINMYYFDGTVFRVRAIGNDGNPVAAGQVVVFKLNKKTYKVKTDKNGYAKLKVPATVKPGKYTIAATYQGQTVKNTINVRQSLKLAKTNIKKSDKYLVLVAGLKNGKKAVKAKKLLFRFNGKNYIGKTNSKGVAKVVIKQNVLKKLKAGKKVAYAVTYLKSTVKRSAKVMR